MAKCWIRLISCVDPKHEHICLIVLFIFGMIFAIGVSFLDIIMFDLYWTVWAIYIPLFVVLCFGLWAYLTKNAKGLFAFNILLPIEMVAVFGLAIYLFIAGTFFGIFAIIMDYLIGWILYGTLMLYKEITNDTSKQDQV